MAPDGLKGIQDNLILLYFAINLPSAHKMWGSKKQLFKREYLMEHLNRIELKGRIGTIRTNEVNGNKVANFSLVTEYLYKTRDGNAVSETTWFNVAAWNNKDMPDFNKIVKGMPVYVSGRMRTSRYTTAEGIEKLYYEILAYKIRFLTEETAEDFH